MPSAPGWNSVPLTPDDTDPADREGPRRIDEGDHDQEEAPETPPTEPPPVPVSEPPEPPDDTRGPYVVA